MCCAGRKGTPSIRFLKQVSDGNRVFQIKWRLLAALGDCALAHGGQEIL
jgi:hypothetical protein